MFFSPPEKKLMERGREREKKRADITTTCRENKELENI
jgi:hypothetical protein